MRRLRFRFIVPVIGVCVVAAGIAAFGANAFGAAKAAGKNAAGGTSSVITVTAGKPTELGFLLSKSSMVPAGTITFKVTNMGIAYHDFVLCVTPVASVKSAQNSCSGKGTKILKHGQTETIKITIAKTGLYEYLCSVPGHAAAGMKGILGVGVSVTSAQEKTAAKAGSTSTTSGGSQYSSSGGATTTTAGGGTTTTRPSSGGKGGSSNPCPPGTTIQTAGVSDADGDEAGTEPDDNDGCI